MTRKITAKPVCEIYHIQEAETPRHLGTLYQWNTGERQMRWFVDPDSFSGGYIGRVEIEAEGKAA